MADRSYYRHESDTRLIEEAKYNPNRELAIALGERLEDVLAEMDEKIGEQKDRAADFERDANKLDDKVYELRVEIDKLDMMLDQRDARIAELEARLKKGN
jgi:septal ring factor EnvC (AmiA/AmiB activator)